MTAEIFGVEKAEVDATGMELARIEMLSVVGSLAVEVERDSEMEEIEEAEEVEEVE